MWVDRERTRLKRWNTSRDTIGRRYSVAGTESAIRERAEERGRQARGKTEEDEEGKQEKKSRGPPWSRRRLHGAYCLVECPEGTVNPSTSTMPSALHPFCPRRAARRRRGWRGRTKLAAISSRFRARSGTTVAPLYFVVGYTSASTLGGIFHTTQRGRGARRGPPPSSTLHDSAPSPPG